MTEFLSLVNFLNFICSIFSLILAGMILRKDSQNWLNRFFFGTFFAWGLNMFFYSFVFLATLGSPLVNLIRDINVMFGIIAASFLFFTGITVYYGSTRALNKLIVLIMTIVTIILVIISIINDQIIIVSQESEIFTETIAGLTIFIIPGLLALIGVLLFFRTYLQAEDADTKRRILYFIFGSLSLIVGAIIFGLSALLMPGVNDLVITFIAEILWGIGPLCIVLGIRS